MRNYSTLIAIGAFVVSIIGLVHSVQTSFKLEDANAANQRTKLLTKINEVEITAGKIAFVLEKISKLCPQRDPREIKIINRIQKSALEREKIFRQIRMSYSNYSEPIDFLLVEQRLSDVEVSRQNHQAMLETVVDLEKGTCNNNKKSNKQFNTDSGAVAPPPVN